MSEHDEAESSVDNAALDAAFAARAMSTNFGDLLAAEGVTTVALNADGELEVRYPDGSTARWTDRPT